MAFKVGDKVVPSDTKKWNDKSQYKIIDRVKNKYDRNTYYIKGHPAHWYDEELELFEGVKEMKELTFKEVIANIKEGEVWESNEKTITIKYDQVIIQVKEGYEGRVNGNERMALSLDKKYKLQRKEYTFEEAFKAYEEGKEIESVISAYRIKKLTDGRFRISQKSLRVLY